VVTGGFSGVPDLEDVTQLAEGEAHPLTSADERKPVDDGGVVFAISRRGPSRLRKEPGLLVITDRRGVDPDPVCYLTYSHDVKIPLDLQVHLKVYVVAMPSESPSADLLAEALLSAAPSLDREEQILVVALYRALTRGHPVSPGDLAFEVGVDRDKVDRSVAKWPGVYQNDDGDVVGFWGLALSGMPHSFATEEATISAWCALDPFLIAPLTDSYPIEVRSQDPVTGEEISMTLTEDGIEVSPQTTVISMLRPEGSFDHDVVQSFCHYVWFFASPESGRRWVEEHPSTFLLDVEETDLVARHSWPALVAEALETT